MKFVLFIFALIFILPTSADAQSVGGSLAIKTSNQNPKPQEQINLTLQISGIATQDATIRWFIDQTEDPQLINQTRVTYTTKNVGETTEIQSILTQENGITHIASTTITAKAVDIIIEANTLVPAFYKGRPQPTIGSTLRAIAVPLDGININPNQYSYLWNVDDKILSREPVLGKSSISFTAQHPDDIYIRVDVFNTDGDFIASNQRYIRQSEPQALFYEENPLHGISRNALTDTHTFIGEEMSVRVEPYFMNKNIFQENPRIQWTVNGERKENTGRSQQIITLRNSGVGGLFTIGFDIRNIVALTQSARNSFSLTF